MTDLDIKVLIHKILIANHLKMVLDIANWKAEYREIVRWLHPDRCRVEGSVKALIHLYGLRENFEKGTLKEDDAGKFRMKDTTAIFQGNIDLLKLSYNRFVQLKIQNDSAARHFQHYLPESMALTDKLEVRFKHRVVPLSGLELSQQHVMWILSRMLETCAWFAQMGYVHTGINPESVFVVPETHGIVIGSFYHFTPIGGRLKTLSARYKNWYPDAVFDTKKATTNIDLELCKRTAAYLLGDTSGTGVKLLKTCNKALVNFLLDTHTDAYDCYDAYRKMLKRNFKSRFHELKV